ncbi:hypothetical protein OB919_15880 [Halobacteria archaeon AArc-curdl1]|uniref:Uncharacterized protein n=1 Tax=Natronosalvus hydrolyticus TaxID=2979988 RepID=A0AAP3E8N8_9EURY|nr:hypothetical protein [Halobacteria archaeon AArc-curdl1]
MIEDLRNQVREKDAAVLLCIERGEDDVQKITSTTSLSNGEVNYSFRKLENLGLIEVEKQDGMVERVVDGTKQVFEAPKKAELTGPGEKYVELLNDGTLESFEDMNRDELVRNVQRLDREVEELWEALEAFRKQVQRKLN